MRGFIKKALGLMLIAAVVCSLLSGCSDNRTICDFKELCTIGYSEYYSSFIIQPREHEFYVKLSDGTYNSDYAAANFYNSVNYNYDQKSDLKNGDRIKVKVTYNEKFAETLKLKIVNAEFTVTVEGMED